MFSGLETDLDAANISMSNKIIVCLGGNTFMQFVVYSKACDRYVAYLRHLGNLSGGTFTIEFSGAILGNCQRASCNWLCFRKALS